MAGIVRKLKNKNDEEPPPQAEPRPAPPAEDESNWLVSYADMMTLLCGFFIMMFSMARLDEPQFEKVKESIAHSFGGDYKSPNKELAKFVTSVLQQEGIDAATVLKVDPTGLTITFKSALFFDTLSADVSAKGKVVLARLIDAVSERQEVETKRYRVVVEGHTDGRPILGGSYPSNWELSGARASKVIRMFQDKGFNADRLTAIGYAGTYPVAEERDSTGAWVEDSLSKNRRVVLHVLEPFVDVIPMPKR